MIPSSRNSSSTGKSTMACSPVSRRREKRQTVPHEVVHRAAEPFLGRERPRVLYRVAVHALVALPYEEHGREQRVEGAERGQRARQGDARGVQALATAFEDRIDPDLAQRARHQPVRGPVDEDAVDAGGRRGDVRAGPAAPPIGCLRPWSGIRRQHRIPAHSIPSSLLRLRNASSTSSRVPRSGSPHCARITARAASRSFTARAQLDPPGGWPLDPSAGPGLGAAAHSWSGPVAGLRPATSAGLRPNPTVSSSPGSSAGP